MFSFLCFVSLFCVFVFVCLFLVSCFLSDQYGKLYVLTGCLSKKTRDAWPGTDTVNRKCYSVVLITHSQPLSVLAVTRRKARVFAAEKIVDCDSPFEYLQKQTQSRLIISVLLNCVERLFVGP